MMTKHACTCHAWQEEELIALIYANSVMANNVVLKDLNHTTNLWKLLCSRCRIDVVEFSFVLFYETVFSSYHFQKKNVDREPSEFVQK